ncbi:tandem-95 repeat protein, partial [Sphingomonas colocasiae]
MTIAPTVYIAAPGTLFNQSGIDITDAYNLSEYVTAESFTLAERRTLTTITAALNDDSSPDNGILDGFSGTLSWGIYSSVGGAPGTLLFTGADSSPIMVDTGLNYGSTDDIILATIDLGVTLDAGTYFIVLHEGAWGSAYDGSKIWWMKTNTDIGSDGAYLSSNFANPSGWIFSGGSAAFSLNETPVYAATEQVALNLKGNVSIADSDVGGNTMTVTLSVGYGILTATAGDSGASVSGSGTGTVTLTGTLAQVNDLLGANSTSSFTFTANTDAPPASTVLTVTAQEPGDATPSAPVTQTITIAAVNDAPTATVSASAYAATEQVALSLKGTVSVADDSGNASITVTLGVGYGVLTVSAGTSGANVSGSGTNSVTLTGTLAQINDLLGTNATSVVSFTADTDTPPANTTLTVGINDGGNSGSGGALTGSATQTINITAINDAPVISNLNGDSVTWTEGNGALLIDASANAAITDADSTNFDGGTLTVSITGGLVSAQDQLVIIADAFITLGAPLPGGDRQVYYNGTQIGLVAGGGAGGGALSFSFYDPDGRPAPPVGAVQALLRTIGYTNSGGDAPSGGARTISWTLNDGDGGSTTVTSTVNVAAVNDAPTAAVSASAYAATEQVALNLKGTVSVADVDAGSGSITVTLGVGYGILTVSAGTSGANVSGSGTGTVTLTGTLAQISDLLNTNATSSVTFTANTDTPSASTTLTVGINDGGNTGSGGALTGSASQTINITAVNDAPTAAVSASAYAATEQVALNLKGTVSVADADAASDSVTVTLSVGYGILTVSAGTGGANVSGSGTGTVTLTGTLAQINDLLNTNATSSVTFTANTDTPPASTTLTVGINDGGNSGSGGALTGSASQTIAITAVNDLPVGVGDNYATDEDTALVISTPGVLSNDTDADGDVLTAVLVSGPSHGTLTLNPNGSFTYTPDADYHGSDSFSYRPNDGTANGAPTTVALTVNSVNDAPANLAIDSDRVNEGAAAGTVVGTATASDVDGDTIIWSLSGADAGLFHIDANGVITTTGTTATFESRPSYSLTVRA